MDEETFDFMFVRNAPFKTITDKEIRINGYNYEQCPSENTRTGGVIIFIKRHKYKVNDIKSVSDHICMYCLSRRLF
jgi:hypothetical protein